MLTKDIGAPESGQCEVFAAIYFAESSFNIPCLFILDETGYTIAMIRRVALGNSRMWPTIYLSETGQGARLKGVVGHYISLAFPLPGSRLILRACTSRPALSFYLKFHCHNHLAFALSQNLRTYYLRIPPTIHQVRRPCYETALI